MHGILTFFAHRLHAAWALVLAISVALAVLVAGSDLRTREELLLTQMQTEAQRSSLEIMSTTLNGNLMGSITLLGLIDADIKQDASNGLKSLDSHIDGTLRALGGAFQAEGVFVVGEDGIVKTSWDRINKPSTGLDVRFRPYYKMAMQGKTSVYAAVSMARGDRSLYFTAPVFAERAKSHIGAGALVARTSLDRVDTLLKGKFDHALLLSPQGVVFAATNPDWIGMLSGPSTPQRLQAIRELKQFGPLFEKQDPKALPFLAAPGVHELSGMRYAIGTSPMEWNDPSGPWSLVIMQDLGSTVGADQAVLKGVGAALLSLVLGWMWINLLRSRRVQDAAAVQLQAFAQKQESSVVFRTRLAHVAARLQRSDSLQELAQVFLGEARELLGVVHGVVYAFDELNGNVLRLVGSSSSSDSPPATLTLGEGLLGQCAQERKLQQILTPPDGFWTLRSGLGATRPQALWLAPMVLNDTLIGVVELAVLQVPHDGATQQLEEMLALLTNSLEILRRNLRTAELLQQSERQGLTLQSQAEEMARQKTAIEATEAWYRGIIESAPDGMLVTDEQGLITLANPKLEAMFGYAAGELIAQPIEVLVPEAARKQHVGMRDGYAKQGENRAMGSISRELRGVCKDGSTFAVEVGLSRLPSLAGRGANVCASVRDITQRKEGEEKLRMANFLSDQALDLTKAGHWHIPLNTGDEFYNSSERAATIFGDPPRPDWRYHLMNEWFACVEAGDKDAAAKTFENYGAALAGTVPRYDATYAYKRPVDGRVIWVHAMGHVVRDASGTPTDMFGVTVDVTETKLAEFQLEERMAELERFHRLTIDREEKMIELKVEINTLLQNAGLAAKYKIVT